MRFSICTTDCVARFLFRSIRITCIILFLPFSATILKPYFNLKMKIKSLNNNNNTQTDNKNREISTKSAKHALKMKKQLNTLLDKTTSKHLTATNTTESDYLMEAITHNNNNNSHNNNNNNNNSKESQKTQNQQQYHHNHQHAIALTVEPAAPLEQTEKLDIKLEESPQHRELQQLNLLRTMQTTTSENMHNMDFESELTAAKISNVLALSKMKGLTEKVENKSKPIDEEMKIDVEIDNEQKIQQQQQPLVLKLKVDRTAATTKTNASKDDKEKLTLKVERAEETSLDRSEQVDKVETKQELEEEEEEEQENDMEMDEI